MAGRRCLRRAVDRTLMAYRAQQTVTEAIDPTVMRSQTRVGTTLRGKWHLDVLLGVGGMAAVYAATHRNGTRAAIKVLHPELCTHADIRARFLREGRVANTIQHDGAVKVLDEDEDNGSVYLVMELLDGESLEARAARAGGKLPVDEVLAAADQLLDVLIAAHEKGVIHRDLKPENVFLTRAGKVMVLDFGIARLRELSAQSHATRDGSTMGTPAYMAPEQARGLWEEVDARADLWAVGATMFSLLTGRAVHEGRTTNEVLVAAVTQKAPRLASLLPDIPQPVASLVDRALAFDKDDRWPDAQAMQEAVRRAYHAASGAPISTHPKLFVPVSVPNRTLPSADLALPPSPRGDRTSAAVVAGRSGVALRSLVRDLPQGAVIGAGVLAVGLVIAFVIVVSVVLTPSSDPPAGASAGPTVPQVATTPAGAPLTPSVDGGAAVVSIDELPTAEPPKKAVDVPAPKTKPTPRVPATSWKDERR